MSTVIIVIGLLIIVIGLIVFLRKPPPPDPPPDALAAEGPIGELKGVLEAVLKILEKFDKRYLPGIFLMLFGLGLVGLGVWIEARDAKDAAEAALVLTGPGLLRLRSL